LLKVPEGQRGALLVALHLLRGVVFASVVYNDHLKIRKGLLFEMVEALQQRSAPVVGRNDNAQRFVIQCPDVPFAALRLNPISPGIA
jgi:hypothetical protein